MTQLRPARHRELIEATIAAGIRLIDTSSMYGDAERLLADAPDGRRDQVLIADKIWTPSPEDGAAQLVRAAGWYGGHIDLTRIRNLVARPAHLPILQAARAQGRVGLIGACRVSNFLHTLMGRYGGSTAAAWMPVVSGAGTT